MLLRGAIEFFHTVGGVRETVVVLRTEQAGVCAFANAGLLGERLLSASVAAVGPADVLQVAAGDFEALAERDPALGYLLIRRLSVGEVDTWACSRSCSSRRRRPGTARTRRRIGA